MTFLEVAEKVLSASKRPMRPSEIVAAAIAKGWLSSLGKMPDDTMGVRISENIKKGGKMFVRTSPGFYALAEKKPHSTQPDLFDEAKKDSGYVYILTNPSFRRDWVKIGMTERPVNTRSKELGNTAVPLPFEIYATLKTNHRRKIEHLLHGSIDDIAPKKRIRKTREFFNIAPETALKLLVRAAKVFDEEQNIDEVFKHGQPEGPMPKANATTRAKHSSSATRTATKRTSVTHGSTKRSLAPVSGETLSNATQLSRLIARRNGNEGAAGGVLLILAGKRRCPASSKWRKPLEEVCIKFDASDFVSDWRCARKVLNFHLNKQGESK